MNKPNINKKPWPGAVSLWATAALMSCFGLAQLAQPVGECTEIASGLDLPVGTAWPTWEICWCRKAAQEQMMGASTLR